MENDLGENLLRYNIDNEEFIVWDCETEGLNLYFDRPWQIGWLECKGKKIVNKQEYCIWWPNLHINKGAAIATHFNYSDYKCKAKSPEEVYEIFHPHLFSKNKIRLGHNILKIDIYMINSWRRAMGLATDYSFINNRLIDTDALAKGIKKGVTPQKPLINWMYKYSSYIEKGLKTNLGLLCKEYKIFVDENRQHEGLYDAELNWEVFLKQIYETEISV
jgi:DNA polymerase III alpha subunit (gram-positive type)